jgi:hypothetical protein
MDRKLDYVFAGLFFLVAVATGIVQITFFETAGDSISYWTAADRLLQSDLPQWYLGGDVERRITRLSVVIPAMIAKVLTGNHPLGYHAAPITMFAVSVMALYLGGARLAGRAVGICSAVLLLVFPSVVRNTVQLLPGNFEGAYLLLSALSLIFYINNPRIGLLVISAAGLFLAYSAKVTALFAAPAIFLALIIYRIPLKHLIIFLAALVVFYVVEAAVLYNFGYPYGRFDFLLEHRGPMNHKFMIATSLSDFLSRWSGMHVGRFWVHLRDYLIISVGICLFINKRSIRILALILIAHALITTFAIRSVDPVRMLTNPQMRYLTIYAPIAILFVCLSGYFAICKVGEKIARKNRSLLLLTATRTRKQAIMLVVLVLFNWRLFYEWTPIYSENLVRQARAATLGEHAIQKIVEYNRLFRTAYSMGTPILVELLPEAPVNTINKTRGISAIYLRQLGERPQEWQKGANIAGAQYWSLKKEEAGTDGEQDELEFQAPSMSVIGVTNLYAPNGQSSNWREVHPVSVALSDLESNNM